VWEIAHDFLARLLGQLVGRLRPTFLQRTRLLVAPLVLMGWIALAVVALPYWMTIQERAAEQALRDLGAKFGRAEPSGGLAIEFKPSNDDALIKAVPYLKTITAHELSLDGKGITDFDPIKGLTRFKTLNLSNAFNLINLEPLKRLTNLSKLVLSGLFGTSSFEPLKGLTNLSELSLQYVDLNRGPDFGLKDLAELVIRMDASRAESILKSRPSCDASLEPLEGLTNLSKLTLSCATSLEPLKGLINLSELVLYNARGVTSLEPLKGMTNLSRLTVYDATGVISLGPLEELTNLRELVLSGATGITSLEPLKALTNLSLLDLTGVTGITSVEPLKELTKLSSLDLTGATGITTLEPLRGRGIGINGASDALLETKR
jgi:Leucine-rich repeat (LRR) protein